MSRGHGATQRFVMTVLECDDLHRYRGQTNRGHSIRDIATYWANRQRLVVTSTEFYDEYPEHGPLVDPTASEYESIRRASQKLREEGLIGWAINGRLVLLPDWEA